MEVAVREPRRIWWARPRKLCALERPGGGGRNHRADRRAAEVEYLRGRGVRMVVSVMRTRHNLAAYEAAGLDWHHVPVRKPEDGAQALEELLPLLRYELESAGAVALHGDSYTDFVAAVCAAHLHEVRGADPAEALARAAAAGLTVTPDACALLGVEVWELEALMRIA
ncbi:MAG: hypothetical protein QOD71_2029 [Thermoleophilaceae bacterium]|jgi:hypothetical protein|nr:hypothetical protein [Thermoleophilaceae bacterium]